MDRILLKFIMHWYVSLHSSSSQKLMNSKPYGQHILCSVTWLSALLNVMFCPDIDHLTRILVLCGTPAKETVAKITSEEVITFSCVSTKGSQIYLQVLKVKQLCYCKESEVTINDIWNFVQSWNVFLHNLNKHRTWLFLHI
jgi:hypothetical protein